MSPYIRPEIKQLIEQPGRISWAQYEMLRMNSYEREVIHSKLDDEALARVALHYASNTSVPVSRCGLCTTYDEALVGLLVPMMASRLLEIHEQSKAVKSNGTAENFYSGG